MSIPMIFRAASRASSGVLARMMPPALPRPPTGTWALTATGPSAEQAAAASSGVRATLPGGIAMPSEARSSLAWYSRSFKSRLSVLATSEGDVAVPFRAAAALLAKRYAQCVDELAARPARLDHVVDVAALRGDVRVGETFHVIRHQLAA